MFYFQSPKKLSGIGLQPAFSRLRVDSGAGASACQSILSQLLKKAILPTGAYGTNPTAVTTIPRARASPGAKKVWSTSISTVAVAPAACTGADSNVYDPGSA